MTRIVIRSAVFFGTIVAFRHFASDSMLLAPISVLAGFVALKIADPFIPGKKEEEETEVGTEGNG